MDDRRMDETVRSTRRWIPIAGTGNPAAWVGQIVKGATRHSGDAIARAARERSAPNNADGTTINADPEIPPITSESGVRE
jgi:hypothetical protein